MNLLNHKTGRGLIAFAFYFAEGAPIGFIWWAMPTLLRQNGAAANVIGSFTAILTLPWVFKFLWAPFIDIYRTPKFGFTQWIGLSQTLMCLSLVPLIFIPLQGNIILWGMLLFIHSICAATQDVSVDALVINVVAKKEKGMLNGYMQAGMLTGRSLFGGAALIFSQYIGLSLTIGLMIMAIMLTMLLLPFIKEPAFVNTGKANLLQFRKTLLNVLLNKRTLYCIAFAFTAAAAFEVAGAFAGPLFTDLKISQQTIGFFFAVPVVIAMLIGGLIGGYLSDKMGRKKAVGFYLAGFVLMIICIALLGILNPTAEPYVWILLFSGMYFFTGMFTVASYALFMDVSHPSLAATQFSSFMAATNACEVWVVYSAGFIVLSYGYHYAFLVMCGVSLLSLLFLSRIRNP